LDGFEGRGRLKSSPLANLSVADWFGPIVPKSAAIKKVSAHHGYDIIESGFTHHQKGVTTAARSIPSYRFNPLNAHPCALAARMLYFMQAGAVARRTAWFASSYEQAGFDEEAW